MIDEEELLGIDAEHAATVLGVSMHQLAGWELNGLVRPRLRATVSSRVLRLYAFDELLELAIVCELSTRGITTHRIRQLVNAYRSFTPSPLREFRWAVEGSKVFVHDGEHWMGGREPAQGVLREVINLEELRASLKNQALQRPAESHGRTERRDRVQGRRLVFVGTRTPVAAVQAYLRRDFSDADILAAYPHLSPADIDTARRLLTAS